MTALCSGVSHCTQSTDAGPRVILDDSRLQRWGTWRHRTAACPRALGVLSRCRQWMLKLKVTATGDTWRHWNIPPPPSPACHRTTVTLLWVLGRETSEKKVLKKRSGMSQQCTVSWRCSASPACSTAISPPPSEPSQSLTESTLQESFLHTNNGK